jgi:MOSC domain-containing protein YiiM
MPAGALRREVCGTLQRTWRSIDWRSATVAAVKHLKTDELEAGLDHVRSSPADAGTVELIVRRPDIDLREVIEEGELDLEEGLVGDNWRPRGSGAKGDAPAHPDKQVALINSRCVALLAGHRDRWQLAGDQFHVDFDLSTENLPAGSRLQLGSAVIEITDQLHLGCAKFSQRFGVDALRLVNSDAGRRLRLRGVYARVVQPGTVRQGSAIAKI